MDWLAQNWVWILLAVGAVWMVGRGGMAGCGMGGHGGHAGHGGGAGPDGLSSDAARRGGVATTIPEKALDPVSGHEVLTAHARGAAYQGRFFFFESEENRRRFEAAPQQYAASPPPQPRRRHGAC